MQQFSVPFTLDLGDASNDHAGFLSCDKVVREVPGKRLVCTGEWRGEEVFAKIFLPKRGTRRRWQREERTVRALSSNGIRTAPLLYSGYLQALGVYVLVFRAIVGAANALQAWRVATSDADRMALLRRLVKVVAEHHNAGLVQRDLHLENFLAKGPDIYTIDASRMQKVGRPVAKKKSMDNLGLLFAQLYPEFDRFVVKVYPDYVRVRRWDYADSDLAMLKPSIERNRARRTKNYLRRIRKERTEFPCQQNQQRLTVYDNSYISEEFDGLLQDPDSMLERGVYLKQGNTSTVGLVTASGRRFVIKRYNIKSIWHGLNRSLRRTRASLSWRNALILRFHGIDTARPVALIEQRIGPLRRVSYFVSEYVEGPDAQTYFLSETVSRDTKVKTADKIAQLLNLLAKLKIRHGDLKATNFIISGDRPFLMDLDGMRQYKLDVRFKRAHARDTDRFIKNWEGHPPVRELFAKVEQPSGLV